MCKRSTARRLAVVSRSVSFLASRLVGVLGLTSARAGAAVGPRRRPEHAASARGKAGGGAVRDAGVEPHGGAGEDQRRGRTA